MTFRINTAADLATLSIPADESRVVVSIPTSFLYDASEGTYDAETEALWQAVQDAMGAKGWEWTGAAGIEEDGSGDWMVFQPVA